jgi:hypothetical protein
MRKKKNECKGRKGKIRKMGGDGKGRRRDGVGKQEESVKRDGEDRRESNNKEVRTGRGQ